MFARFAGDEVAHLLEARLVGQELGDRTAHFLADGLEERHPGRERGEAGEHDDPAVRQSLERSLTQACPYCGGSGRIKSNTTIALEIWRELMKLRDFHEGQDVIVRVNPVVYGSLHTGDPIFEEVERTMGIHLVFKPDEALHHEQFDVMRI